MKVLVGLMLLRIDLNAFIITSPFPCTAHILGWKPSSQTKTYIVAAITRTRNTALVITDFDSQNSLLGRTICTTMLTIAKPRFWVVLVVPL
ncbi:hypothetical protein NUU61_000832 [Penicillium alfredii]|uniref:Secreted protein n=1 Tax=Penicillium alfredii TaxID=1506179 RepID=A0A9W9GAE0_9EURO|nr:uncharacterized protein NUU61_000832 [Penicillium alfredii]KAJ5115073.1 hypothetical protein NUU61_000832 [Penicillium alfredii]